MTNERKIELWSVGKIFLTVLIGSAIPTIGGLAVGKYQINENRQKVEIAQQSIEDISASVAQITSEVNFLSRSRFTYNEASQLVGALEERQNKKFDEISESLKYIIARQDRSLEQNN